MMRFWRAPKTNPTWLVGFATAWFLMAIICLVTFWVGPDMPLMRVWVVLSAIYVTIGIFCLARYIRARHEPSREET